MVYPKNSKCNFNFMGIMIIKTTKGSKVPKGSFFSQTKPIWFWAFGNSSSFRMSFRRQRLTSYPPTWDLPFWGSTSLSHSQAARNEANGHDDTGTVWFAYLSASKCRNTLSLSIYIYISYIARVVSHWPHSTGKHVGKMVSNYCSSDMHYALYHFRIQCY